MKKTSTYTLLFFLLSGWAALNAQTLTEGGFGNTTGNDSHTPCITPAEYLILEKQCKENAALLGLDKNTSKATTLFNWPIKAAPGYTDCDFYFISAYVDQITSAGNIGDYNCGTTTYDGHHGTDIALWPYPYYKMDNNQVEVVAAAPGIIIQKADGNFDRNCATNNLTANSLIVQHADGSLALYWHMKQNSVTYKTVGDTVATGEYLGVVGSSGNSTGPHLHFEVWASNVNTSYNDPYAGNCNTLNGSSWWVTQKSHTAPAVLKVSVNTTDITFLPCPQTDVLTDSDVFDIPFQGIGLPAGFAKFCVFMRDNFNGMVVDCEILYPNGSTFNNWTYTSNTNYKGYVVWYSKLLPTTPGIYTFKATYNGVSCSKNFEITETTGVLTNETAPGFSIYPNPTANAFTLAANDISNGNYVFTLLSVTGQVILRESTVVTSGSVNKQFTTEGLSNGVYFVAVDAQNTRTIKKLVIQN